MNLPVDQDGGLRLRLQPALQTQMRQLILTSAGQVEVVARHGDGDWVLYFHGGHESALTASAAQLYLALGYNVLTVSRPGYGATDVGPMSPMDFSALVDHVRSQLGHENFLAVVGTSFGGPQAVAYASQFPGRVRALVLHSAAPSSRPYPDKAMQRLFAPAVFHPRIERFIWKTVSWLMRKLPGPGLRLMMASLSRHPTGSWLNELSSSERQEMRDLFCALRSSRGFVNDVRHAGPEGADVRRRAQQRIACPTLVTASRDDAGVAWEHAEDFLATIPNARLVEIPAASHLFWIGPTRPEMISTIRQFLAPLRQHDRAAPPRQADATRNPD
jgi:pimeloyl-ACP methyl ester carboxylesterase